MKKFLKSTAVALFLCWISSIAVFAAQGKINQVQEDIEGLEKQKEQSFPGHLQCLSVLDAPSPRVPASNFYLASVNPLLTHWLSSSFNFKNIFYPRHFIAS